jgi:hypothetical protein
MKYLQRISRIYALATSFVSRDLGREFITDRDFKCFTSAFLEGVTERLATNLSCYPWSLAFHPQTLTIIGPDGKDLIKLIKYARNIIYLLSLMIGISYCHV